MSTMCDLQLIVVSRSIFKLRGDRSFLVAAPQILEQHPPTIRLLKA